MAARNENKTVHPLSEAGFLRIWDITPDVVPVSRATLWRMVRDGRFPRPIKLGPGTTCWRTSEVRQWLESQVLIPAEF